MDIKVFIFLVIVFTVSEGKLVDLTHPLNENNSMVWPGFYHFRSAELTKGWITLGDGNEAW